MIKNKVMKQTAVEWLYNKMYEHKGNITISEFEQAKEMFEQQIIDAYNEGDNNGADRIYYHSDRDDKSAEQYYNETFKNK